MSILLQMALGVLGAVLPGLLVYGLAQVGCPAPASEASPCWEPVVAATLSAAFGWLATTLWLRLYTRQTG